MTDPVRSSFTTNEGHVYHLVDRKMHSENDQPAVVYANGTKWWYREGKIHRDGAPAVIFPNGVEEWWQNGRRHRDGGPAVIFPSSAAVNPEGRGVRQWWSGGKLIREDLPGPVQRYRSMMKQAYKVCFGGGA